MTSDFPFLIGRIGLNDDWSLDLPLVCKQRFEDGEMVLWRPAFTIWLISWNNDNDESIVNRKNQIASSASNEKYDERTTEAGSRLYYSYRLLESTEDQRVAAMYGFAFSDNGHLQMSFYFDEEKDSELAYKILHSANGDPPSLDNPSVLSRLCFVTHEVMQEVHEVGYMYREAPDNEDDSGWRFFSGDESQDYLDDPENNQICPVAFVAQVDPVILMSLNSEVGSEFERVEDEFWSVD